MKDRRQPPKEYAYIELDNGRRAVADIKGVFINDVLPELGDEVKLVCIERTATRLKIGLQTVRTIAHAAEAQKATV